MDDKEKEEEEIKQKEYLESHFGLISHIDNNFTDMLFIDKMQLEKEPREAMQLFPRAPYTITGIYYAITQMIHSLAKKEITKEEFLSKISWGHELWDPDSDVKWMEEWQHGDETGYTRLHFSWDEWKNLVAWTYHGQYKNLKKETDDIEKSPIKVKVQTKKREDGTVEYKNLDVIFIQTKRIGQPAEEKTGELIDIAIKEINIFVKTEIIKNLLVVENKASLNIKTDIEKEMLGLIIEGKTETFQVENISFYPGLRDAVKHNKYLEKLINLTGHSIQIFWKALEYLRKFDNNKGDVKHIKLGDFWARVSPQEVRPNLDKNGEQKRDEKGKPIYYLRNGEKKSLFFFKVLVLLSCEYDFIFEKKAADGFAARDLHPYRAEKGTKDKTVDVYVTRGYAPPQFLDSESNVLDGRTVIQQAAIELLEAKTGKKEV